MACGEEASYAAAADTECICCIAAWECSGARLLTHVSDRLSLAPSPPRARATSLWLTMPAFLPHIPGTQLLASHRQLGRGGRGRDPSRRQPGAQALAHAASSKRSVGCLCQSFAVELLSSQVQVQNNTR